MDPKEIRLEILLNHYDALKNQNPMPGIEEIEKLKNISEKDYEFNYGVLAELGYLNADKNYSDNGVVCYTPLGGFPAKGIILVERFIDECIKNTQNTTKHIISSSFSYIQKITELGIVWSKNVELFQQALELLSKLIS